jgi:hypothetical protein
LGREIFGTRKGAKEGEGEERGRSEEEERLRGLMGKKG